MFLRLSVKCSKAWSFYIVTGSSTEYVSLCFVRDQKRIMFLRTLPYTTRWLITSLEIMSSTSRINLQCAWIFRRMATYGTRGSISATLSFFLQRHPSIYAAYHTLGRTTVPGMALTMSNKGSMITIPLHMM